MQFEATAQGPDAQGPFPPAESGYPDTITPTWFQYGMNEGVPRLLDLWDRQGIKVTSHMVGQAAEQNPDLAREVSKRGHEVSGHGQAWTPQYTMSREEEKSSYIKSAETLERITGQRPVGFNAFWMRHSRNTLELLQDQGFIYHIDDLGRDEPSVTPVRGRPFVVVPYTLRNNDIVRYSGSTALTAAAFSQNLKDEFDILYKEAAFRRRMMSVSAHDRLAGSPARVHGLEDFIEYAKSHPGVVFMKKVDIARFALQQNDVPKNPPRTFPEPPQDSSQVQPTQEETL
jgi:peptidoglycan/xylan/chitin deacetylase (PgdA/CDA1 family)